MSKATHNGTCQVCGRNHAYNGATIAKHGYTVDFGYFNGTCPGSDNAPLQVSRELSDTVAASLRDTADSLDNRADRLDSGAEKVERIANKVRENGRTVVKMETRDEMEARAGLSGRFAFDSHVRHLPTKLRYSAASHRRAADSMDERADATLGTDLLAREVAAPKPAAERQYFNTLKAAYQAEKVAKDAGHRTMVRRGGGMVTLYIYKS